MGLLERVFFTMVAAVMLTVGSGCSEFICESNSCEGNVLHYCLPGSDGVQGRGDTDCSASGLVCREGHGSADCVLPSLVACQDVSQWATVTNPECSGDVVLGCTSTGYASSEMDCAAQGLKCFRGHCRTFYPTNRCSGSQEKDCGDDGSVLLCAKPGFYVAADACNDGRFCVTGNNTAECALDSVTQCTRPNPKDGSFDVCMGDTLAECGETGHVQSRRDCAANGGVCATGNGWSECAFSPLVACSPGDWRCSPDGAAVLVCGLTGHFLRHYDCPASQRCVMDGIYATCK